MKKLNITKKQYDESKYFNKKYGALKFVSESGKLYKTDKGVVLALESVDDEEPADIVGGGADEEEEVTVKKDDLATALQGVIDTVKDIAADNDVELPEDKEDDEGEPAGDEDEGDELEFDEGKDDDDVCPTCGAKKAKECTGKGCVKKECGLNESTEDADAKKRAERAKMVRESLRRRVRARKIRESIQRRIRAKKVLESIRRRRAAKQVMESLRRRRAAKRVMESRRLRARRARMAK